MKKTLKFLSWMFVAVLSVLSFSSCSDDDEGHPYAGTVWEYEDIYESGTITTRIRFADETKAYYEVEEMQEVRLLTIRQVLILIHILEL